jgi:signal transduction histidine kinase
MLRGVVVVVVGVDEEACERASEPLRRARATVSHAFLNVNALAILSRPGFDAVVVDVVGECGRFLPLAASLKEEGRLRKTPVIGLVDPAIDPVWRDTLDLEHVATQREALPALVESLLARRGVALSDGRERLEEELRMALTRNAALRTQAQSLAHDARALCGIVLGFAANLRDEIVGPLVGGQAGHVTQIMQAATDMATMLDRFGGAVRSDASTRAESSPAPEEPRPSRRTLLDLSQIAVATGHAFGQMVEREGLTLQVEAPQPVLLWGDAMQIKQVVVNLLSNAIKFTPAGGRVTVSVRRSAPTLPREGVAARTRAELEISDTGPGVPAEERDRIFGRGVRLARDEIVDGSGLGLAVAREIVVSHGGGLRAAEPTCGGATFILDLPLDMRTRRETSVVLVDEPEKARRVLVALRELQDASRSAASNAEALATALENCIAVAVIPPGEAALEEWLRRSPERGFTGS